MGQGFVRVFTGANRIFCDPDTGMVIEILITGEYPGDGLPKPIGFPDPAIVAVEFEGIKVIALTKLIELKLASGLSMEARLKDLADVQELIRTLKLTLELADELDDLVRTEYQRLWNTIQKAKGRFEHPF